MQRGIAAGIATSPFTDMPAHTRNLEAAYRSALGERARRTAGGDPAASSARGATPPGARALADAMLAIALAATVVRPRSRALMLRARALEMLRDLPRAIVDVDGALALDPTQRARLERARHPVRRCRARAIAPSMRSPTRRAPTRGYARAWNNLGNALRAMPGAAAESLRRLRACGRGRRQVRARLGQPRRDATAKPATMPAPKRRCAARSRSIRVQRSAMMTLAGLLRDRSDLGPADRSSSCARRGSIRRDATACLELAQTLAERDDLANAREAFARSRAPRSAHAARCDSARAADAADGRRERGRRWPRRGARTRGPRRARARPCRAARRR